MVFAPLPRSLDSEESSDDEDWQDANVTARAYKHHGGVNRVRVRPCFATRPLLVKQLQLTYCLVAVAAACTQVMPQPPHVVATWADTGKVHLFRSKPIVAALNSNAALSKARKALAAGPCFTFNGHPTEGYAMDWSPCVPGRYVAA